MSRARQHLGLKSRKGEEKTYTITITEEQIKTIRSLYMRVDMLYTHRGLAEQVEENGVLTRQSFWRCYFCDRASYEDAASIPHDKDCIIPLADKEFDGLNAQFIAAEHPE